jgi:hypothetical protein
MPDEYKDLINVNQKFYRALDNGNIELMEDVWLKDEYSKCVHPGWPMLVGWDAIKQSWINIFSSGGPSKIEISNINSEVSGNVGWITCLEQITHRVGEQYQIGLAQTTNIFELHGSKWLMVLHHASPVPFRLTDVPDEKLQ